MATYYIEWLDEYGKPYDDLMACTWQEALNWKYHAKYYHLYIRVTNEQTGERKKYNYLPIELYAER